MGHRPLLLTHRPTFTTYDWYEGPAPSRLVFMWVQKTSTTEKTHHIVAIPGNVGNVESCHKNHHLANHLQGEAP